MNFIFQTLKNFKPYFTHVFGVQIYAKITKFHSIILKFDEVMPSLYFVQYCQLSTKKAALCQPC